MIMTKPFNDEVHFAKQMQKVMTVLSNMNMQLFILEMIKQNHLLNELLYLFDTSILKVGMYI